jgi:hypothetical protein
LASIKLISLKSRFPAAYCSSSSSTFMMHGSADDGHLWI